MSVVPLAKRPRVEQLATSSSSLTVGLNNERALREARALQDEEDERSSNLKAPIMLLSGHQGAIFTFKFSPNGERVLGVDDEQDSYYYYCSEKNSTTTSWFQIIK
jgi:hypothetical protein